MSHKSTFEGNRAGLDRATLSSRPETGLRAAIIGAGVMGRYHADAAVRAGGHVVAVVDPTIQRAQSLARGRSAARSLATLDPRVEIDVAHVCAPPGEHVRIANEALAMGAHLILEKPVAPDGPSTEALLAAAKQRGSMVVPVHQFLFQPGIQRLLAERERLGSIVRCVFEAATAGADLRRIDRDELVADILPHPLALFSCFTDAPLSQLEWLVLRPASGELRALAQVDAMTLEIVVSTRGRPTHATLDLVGTAATAHADLFHGYATLENGSNGRTRKVARPFLLAGATVGRASANLTRRAMARESAYPGLRELVHRAYIAIAGDSPPPISEREILDVALARDVLLATIAMPQRGVRR